MFNHTRSWLTPQPQKTCSTCSFYLVGGFIGRLAYLKVCRSPKLVYGYHRPVKLTDECIVANNDEDSALGFSPGPDFGCIHHKEKSV